MFIDMKSSETILKASQTIAERLVWQAAEKDQAGIAEDLASGKDIPEVYGMGEAGMFDEFFCFLDEFGTSTLFEKLGPDLKRRNSNVNLHTALLIYMMRIVSGVPFFWHIESVLLMSQSLMHLVGFNGRQIRQGTTSRGLSQEKKSAKKKRWNCASGKVASEKCSRLCSDSKYGWCGIPTAKCRWISALPRSMWLMLIWHGRWSLKPSKTWASMQGWLLSPLIVVL